MTRIAKQICILLALGSSWASTVAAQPSAAPLPRPQHIASPTGELTAVCHLATNRRRAHTLFITRPGFDGSAVLYRHRYLVTAAHNVYRRWYTRLVELRYSCGRGVIPEPETRLNNLRDIVRVHPRYSARASKPEEYRYDLAVVRLPEPICSIPRITLSPRRPEPESTVRITGFPAQRGTDPNRDGTRLYSSMGRVTVSDHSFLLEYNADLQGGNSGGPVWMDGASGPEVVGIHVADIGARQIEPDVLTWINATVNDLETASPSPPCPS